MALNIANGYSKLPNIKNGSAAYRKIVTNIFEC